MKKIFPLLIVITVLCATFILGGGQIFYFLQPMTAVSLVLLSYGFSAFKIGFRATHSLILGRTNEGASTLFFSLFASTHLIACLYWITYFTKLSAGREQLGQHIALVSMTYVYGMLVMALTHDSESENIAKILGFSSVVLAFLLNVVILM